MNLTPQNNPTEFEQFLFKKIDVNLYHHKFILDYLEDAAAGEKKLYDKSVINVTEEGWILILHGEVLLIYGQNWRSEQFDEISEIIDLKQFTNFSLIGNTELVKSLLAYYKIDDIIVYKERILYKTQTIKNFHDDNLNFVHGHFENIEEIAVMLQQYYHEEYKGENDKSIEDMRIRVLQVIATGKLFLMKNNNSRILGFCTIIDPDIGILFTKPEFRNQGFGKKLLAHCSKLLLEKNKDVYVMTDKNEVGSNKTCTSVGFIQYFNNIFVQINSIEAVNAWV